MRDLYFDYFELAHIPEWTCPECNSGKLHASENGIKTIEYPSSIKQRDEREWEPFWVRGSFLGILQCSNIKCKSKTIFAGDMFVEAAVVEIEEEPNFVMEHVEHIRPKYFNPPLEIISYPKNLNDKIVVCLKESFKLFWSDNSACANRIRVAVEEIMNDKGVPKYSRSKTTNSRTKLTLHHRIELYQKDNEEVGELLLAIKWIGNEGSHELNILTRNDILTAYEILHQCLDKIYNKRNLEILKIAKKINKNKGIKKK
jgi:hypothetical protein